MRLFDFFKKKDELTKTDIEELIKWDEPNGDGCFVSDKIAKEGYKVGYMYREEPDEGVPDSGWRFMAGDEDDEYINDPDNIHILSLNTVCNYDRDIIPYLRSDIGSAYIRVDSKSFREDGGTVPVFVDKQHR